MVLRTFSKAFSLAGARMGYILGDAEVVRVPGGADATTATHRARAARQRDRAQGTVYAAGSAAGTAAAVVVGAVAWAGFAFWGHAWLIGVAPLGR